MHSFKLVFRGGAVSRPVILIALGCGLLGAQDTQSKYELPPDQRTRVTRRISVLCQRHLQSPGPARAALYVLAAGADLRLLSENLRCTHSSWFFEALP